MSQKQYVLAGIAGVLIIGATIGWFLLQGVAPEGSQPDTTETPAASTTPTQPVSVPQKKTLKPEPVFVLPSGAVAVDDYAFTNQGDVYFRSLTSTQPLPVPNAQADSFERVTSFMTYTDPTVVSACGAAPQYAYYRDEKQVYFYHYWRTPTFRSSHIDILIGLKPEDFILVSPTRIKVGAETFDLIYTQATSTCRLRLTGGSLNS